MISLRKPTCCIRKKNHEDFCIVLMTSNSSKMDTKNDEGFLEITNKIVTQGCRQPTYLLHAFSDPSRFQASHLSNSRSSSSEVLLRMHDTNLVPQFILNITCMGFCWLCLRIDQFEKSERLEEQLVSRIREVALTCGIVLLHRSVLGIL